MLHFLQRHEHRHLSVYGLIERFCGLRDDAFFDILSRVSSTVHITEPKDALVKAAYDQRRLSKTPMLAIMGARVKATGAHQIAADFSALMARRIG